MTLSPDQSESISARRSVTSTDVDIFTIEELDSNSVELFELETIDKPLIEIQPDLSDVHFGAGENTQVSTRQLCCSIG